MLIRRLDKSEAELFHTFRLHGLQESPASFGATYEEEASISAEDVQSRFPCTEDNFVLGALNEAGRLIGVACFFRLEAPKVHHKGMIWGMYVAAEERCQGVGKALLSGLIERAKALSGLEQVILDMVVPNEAARNLYLRRGFEIIALEERAMKHNGVYYDVEHMVLYLT